MSDSIYLLRDLLAKANYRVGGIEEDRSFLAESAERVVWVVLFETAQELLVSWQETQVQAIGRTESLAPEKAWELYLLLATELEPHDEVEVKLNAVRRDTSYARKVVAPGLATLTEPEIDGYLAPLRALEIGPAEHGPDAISLLNQAVVAGSDPTEIAVLQAFEANRPLFGNL